MLEPRAHGLEVEVLRDKLQRPAFMCICHVIASHQRPKATKGHLLSRGMQLRERYFLFLFTDIAVCAMLLLCPEVCLDPCVVTTSTES